MTVNQNDRRSYIGGSSVSLIMCGELYGRTAHDLCKWYQHLIDLEQPTGGDIERGRSMETTLFNLVAVEKKVPLVTAQKFIIGDGVTVPDYVAGTVDGLVYDDNLEPYAVLELKCPRGRTLRDWRNWGLPASHLWQVRLYMALWDVDKAIVAALDYDEWRPVYWEIDRDLELESLMFDEIEQFWECVMCDEEWAAEPPEIDAPPIGAEAVEATLWQERDLLEYRELQAEIDARKERLAEIKKDFESQWPPEAKRIVSEHGTVSMSTRTTTTVDRKRLESEWPDVYEAVTTTNVGAPSASFRMKKGAGQ